MQGAFPSFLVEPDALYGDELGYTNDYSYQKCIQGKSYDNRWMASPDHRLAKRNAKADKSQYYRGENICGTKKIDSKFRKPITSLFADQKNLTWALLHIISMLQAL